MSLKIEIAIEKTELRVHENPRARVTLSNEGAREVRLPDPLRSEGWPRFRMVRVENGAEVPRSSGIRRSGEPDPEIVLAAGKSVGCSMGLLSEVQPGAGRYEVTALYEAGDETVESEPVEVEVRKVTPSHLRLDEIPGPVFYGVWVDVASDPPEIVRSRFDLHYPAPIDESVAVGAATHRTAPVLSLPAAGGDRRKHRVAWMDGPDLRYATFSDGSIARGKVEVGVEGEIVAPFFHDGSRAELLLAGDSALALVRLPEGEVLRTELRGPRPSWMKNHTSSEAGHRAVFFQRHRGELSLSLLPWSGKGIGVAKPLANWSGSLLAASSASNLDGEIQGAHCRWADRGPEVVSWRIDGEGSLQETDRNPIPWNDSEPIPRARMRVGPDGEPSLLLTNDAGEWFLRFRGETVPLPPSVRESRLPIDLAFDPRGEPLLISAHREEGFRIQRIDGSR